LKRNQEAKKYIRFVGPSVWKEKLQRRNLFHMKGISYLETEEHERIKTSPWGGHLRLQ